jgi:DNA-binding CsgD family transcriptional regulator
VLEETSEWRLTTEAQHLRCRIEMWRGHPVVARDLLITEAGRVEPKDPAWSAIMRAHASLASAMLGQQQLAASEGQRAVELLADLPDSVTMPALAVRALTLATSGLVAEARAMLARCEEFLGAWDPLASDQVLLVAALAWTSLEEPEEAMRWLEHAVSSARQASALGLLPFQLSWLALEQWRGGYWAVAYSNAHDAVALAEETGWETELPNSLAALATIEAGMGLAENCREHAARAAALGKRAGAVVIEARTAIALALLESGNGDALGATQHLEFVAAFARSHGLGDPVLLNWAGDLAEALYRAGEPDRALAVWQVAAAEAERTRRPTQAAVTARCRGLLAGNEQAARDAFAEALSWHAQAAQPFQEARTRLVHGEVLRRYRRRAEARAELNAALGTRARYELRATGISVKPHSEPSRPQLTPQELRVALKIAEGATNAEAAAQLFLSAKTVEYHLSGIYRKLGLRSRTQLTRTLVSATRPGDFSTA